MKYLIENISKIIVKEYDYLIIHLLGDGDTCDNIDYSKTHNFQAGVIAGMTKGLKKNHQSNYYIAHTNNGPPGLRSSDVEIFDTYNSHGDIVGITNRIIQRIC